MGGIATLLTRGWRSLDLKKPSQTTKPWFPARNRVLRRAPCGSLRVVSGADSMLIQAKTDPYSPPPLNGKVAETSPKSPTYSEPSTIVGPSESLDGANACPTIESVICQTFLSLLAATRKACRQFDSLTGSEVVQAYLEAVDLALSETNQLINQAAGSSQSNTAAHTTHGNGHRLENSAPTDGFRGRKRARKDASDDDKDDDNNGEGGGSERTRSVSRAGDNIGKRWACHFFKLDPLKHSGCAFTKLRGVADQRQHIKRNHLYKPHCPTCGKLFDKDLDESKKDDHIRLQGCTQKSFPHSHSVTKQQWKDLNADSERKNMRSLEQRWFDAWDIIFPRVPRPLSPYLTGSGFLETFQFVNSGGILRERAIDHLQFSRPEGLPDRQTLRRYLDFFTRQIEDHVVQQEDGSVTAGTTSAQHRDSQHRDSQAGITTLANQPSFHDENGLAAQAIPVPPPVATPVPVEYMLSTHQQELPSVSELEQPDGPTLAPFAPDVDEPGARVDLYNADADHYFERLLHNANGSSHLESPIMEDSWFHGLFPQG